MQNVQGQEETVMHLTSECSKMAQLEYKKRRDIVGGIVHWSLRSMACHVRNNGTDIRLN